MSGGFGFHGRVLASLSYKVGKFYFTINYFTVA